MRGIKDRKNKERHNEGSLRIPMRTLNPRGTAIHWMKGLKHKEEDKWNTKEDDDHDEESTTMQVLRHVTCPECDAKKDMEKYKIYGGKVGFARIKCMKCNIINTADKWRCSCKLLWQKCRKHIVKAQENAYDKQKGHQSGKIRGVKKLTKHAKAEGEAPHPIRRKTKELDAAMPAAVEEVRNHFKADHILARRFPALYAKQVMNERIREERRSSTSNTGQAGSGGQPSSLAEQPSPSQTSL